MHLYGYCLSMERAESVLKYKIIPVTHYQQNCSLLWCGTTKEAVLVDPGGDLTRIEAVLREVDVNLVKIILTHGHLDHVGATALLVEKYGVPVEGPHKDDDFWLNQLEQQAQMMGFAPVPQVVTNRYLIEGDEVLFGEIKLDVLHCPGHTPGHVVFVDRVSRLALVGDVLFHGSIGRSDFPRGDHQTLVNSITQKLWPLGDDIDFIPGHGPMSTFREERANNPFVADKVFG